MPIYWGTSPRANAEEKTMESVEKAALKRRKADELRRAYKREWAKQHPDRVKAYQERYWNKRAAAALEKEQLQKGAEEEESS